MKIESPTFTAADLDHYRDELSDHERQVLADRLERASARLAAVGTPNGEAAIGGTIAVAQSA